MYSLTADQGRVCQDSCKMVSDTSQMDSLGDSSRTTVRKGSVCTDTDMASDMTSDITSACSNSISLDDFEIGSEIGRGKFSTVHKARHKRTGQLFALKRVSFFEMDLRSRQDCAKEVKFLTTLRHKHVIVLYAAFMQANELYILLEYAVHGDLAHQLATLKASGGQVQTWQAWDWFRQICAGLQHMHAYRMMHRDLKPSNILVCTLPDGRSILKLSDFGLSRHFSSKTFEAKSFVGTPYYMSPECMKHTSYGFAADIWSLGCILYELVVGYSPFHLASGGLYQLGKAIFNSQYDLAAVACPRARFLVHRMLAADKHARPGIDAVLQFVRCTCAVIRERGTTMGAAPCSLTAEEPQRGRRRCLCEEYNEHVTAGTLQPARAPGHAPVVHTDSAAMC